MPRMHSEKPEAQTFDKQFFFSGSSQFHKAHATSCNFIQNEGGLVTRSYHFATAIFPAGGGSYKGGAARLIFLFLVFRVAQTRNFGLPSFLTRIHL